MGERLASVLDPMETRLQQMSRVVCLMQRMKLFGTHFWLGRQTFQIPRDKIGLENAPKAMCKINPKEPDAEYWICVDLYGVRFVAVDNTRAEFHRGFMFHEGAVERVVQ